MKKFLVLMVISLLIFSCSPKFTTGFSRLDDLRMINFKPYSEKGFLFTPEKYPGDVNSYESIGVIDYTISGSAEYRRLTQMEFSKSKKIINGLFAFRGDQSFFYFEKANKDQPQWIVEGSTLQEALDSMYVKAKSIGADAIVNFKVTRDFERHMYPEVEEGVALKTYNITGFAIKRK